MVDQSSLHLEDDAWLETVLQRIEEAQERGETLDLAPFLAQRPHLRECILVLGDLGRDVRPGRTDAPSVSAGWPQLPGFEVLAELGTGGMGTVYLAEQREPIRRRVALKVIKLGMDTKAVLARFEAERQALALMDHPSIAKVFEAGATPDGRPYFAMEYVKGLPITRYCDDHRLAVEERLRLFRQVCSGVQHAHQKGVIHRDLTPNNVLVAVHDDKPVAKIIDFGLARATDHRLTEKTLFTEQGVILGTPEYMSPEQAGLNALDIDMRSDVYTLGVLLYELLTGALPFSREQLRQAGYDKMCAIIRTQEPERPSTRITRQAKGTELAANLRRTDADKLLRRLRGDLDWVVLKCLEKDRTRRYETVSALADDVQRHLDDEPVVARAPSVGYRFAKFARRYRGQLIGAAAVLGALVGGLGLATYFWLDASEQAEEATRQAGIADAERQEARRQARDAELARAGEAAKAREAAERSVEAVARKAEFDQLAGVVLYERALAAEKELYPAWPHKVAAMERWLREDAGRLLSMRPQIKQTVADLRARALPATAEEIERDRTSHSKFTEWQRQAAKLAALARAHAIRTKAQELTLPLATAEEQAMTPAELNARAWSRVGDFDETIRIWGEEAKALVLAQLAWEKAAALAPKERASFGDTLAWAWFANGRDAEALAQSEAALALAPAEERSEYESYLARLKAKLSDAAGDAGAKALADLRGGVANLKAEVGTRRTFRFAAESQGFLHGTLSELAPKLASLENTAKAVAERLAWARRIEALTLGHPRAHVTWQAARESISKADGIVASALYRGQRIELRDEDVIGLVPIGMNPATELWEFYELRSAWDGMGDPGAIEIPRYIEDGERAGHIEVGDGTGVVFVLLPGGTFVMGSQDRYPSAPNYDPEREPDEGLHEATLAPFFLARHELTQRQWQRLSGAEMASRFTAGSSPGGGPRVTWSNPVVNVEWSMCVAMLARHGMVLPSEAQWEYGSRAGTTTVWLCDFDQLRRFANVADATTRRRGNAPTWKCEDWNDGHVAEAQVGSFLPNAFGLFDVHGNVSEWTRDADHGPGAVPRAGDGLRGDPSSSYRVFRGGSFATAARYARSASRGRNSAEFRSNGVGLRVARELRLH